ncbi:GH-E family nuclease [Microbacterium resistens]|uniref:GH-E family nuclease n=1 Tax=Microbacterium resistens TaxID=156977 RepID=UPI0037CB17C8
MRRLCTVSSFRLRKQYLSGQISRDDFLRRYRDPDRYRVEDPLRNQSHVDEYNF